MKILFNLLFAVGFIVHTAVVFAEPVLTINRVAQRYPWNGLVDIDYILTGSDDSACYVIEFTCSGKRQDGEAFSVTADTFLSAISTENGTHRATWDANADGADFFAKGAQMTAVVRFKPIKTDGDYMIVDLTGGTNAAIWRITYMSDVADPAATFNTDEYKTTKLVLKKVKAGSFWMGSASDQASDFYDDKGTYNNNKNGENPRHYVTLTKDYFIGAF